MCSRWTAGKRPAASRADEAVVRVVTANLIRGWKGSAQTLAIVFVGGGRITAALAAGLRLAGDRQKIIVFDRNLDKLRALKRESGITIASDLKSAVEAAEILVIAVRPASVGQALEEINTFGVHPGLCVSLAAGIPLAKLKRVNLRAFSKARWVRAMPSPVCRSARGLTALCFDRKVAKKDRMRVRNLFARVGQVIEVSEPRFDAFTVAYSSSHGYHALATLANAAQRAGLDRKTALMAAAHALADGILYWRESASDLSELLHEACTPGGIAAASVNAMEAAGYVRVVNKGLAAGLRQARRNAKT